MRLTALFVLSALLAFGAGTCTVTGPSQVGQVSTSETFVATIDCVGDAATGSFPATAISGLLSNAKILQGAYVSSVVVNPGTPSPTASYSLTLVTDAAADLLGGTAAGVLSATATQSFTPPVAAPISGMLTVTLTGNSVASAATSVQVNFSISSTVPSTLLPACTGAVTTSCTPQMSGAGVYVPALPAPSGGAVGGASTLTTGYVPVSDTVSTSLKNSKIRCSGVGVCTIYDDTAVTGVTTLVVRAGPGQGLNNLQEWKSAAGVNFASLDYTGVLNVLGISDGTGASSFGSSGIVLGASNAISFTPTATWYGSSPDLGLSRLQAGRAQITSGTSGRWAGLDVGSLYVNALATPGAPTVTPTCPDGACASTWTYTCTALAGDGTTTVPGASASTAVNNATLDATHYNTVTCPAVTGASYNTIRRTVSGGTPASVGRLTGCTSTAYGTACVDVGLVGDASAAPAANTTGQGLFAGNVGIGTTGPGSILHTKGISTNEIYSETTSGAASAGIRFIKPTQSWIVGAGSGIGDLNFYIYNFTGGTNPLTVLATNGNVGIGTTGPDRLLHVELADAGTNTVVYTSRQSHVTSGTAAAGFGAGAEVELENAAGTNRVASAVETSWKTATDTAEDSYRVIKVMQGGTLKEAIRIVSDIGIQFASGVEPACAAGTRGTVIYVAGGAGVADTVRVCAKSTLDAYSWIPMATIP